MHLMALNELLFSPSYGLQSVRVVLAQMVTIADRAFRGNLEAVEMRLNEEYEEMHVEEVVERFLRMKGVTEREH